MGGTDPLCSIGHPNALSQRRARSLLAGLAIPKPGKLQHHLLALGQLWFPISSCFGGPRPHALCSVADLERVAELVTHRHPRVRLTALHALSQGLRCLRHLEGEAPMEPKIVASLVAALADEDNLVRLQAVALLRFAPVAPFADALRPRLRDPVYSVRWGAVTALARLEPTAELAAVLEESRPRKPDDHCFAFPDAVDAVGSYASRSLRVLARKCRFALGLSIPD